VAAAVSESSGNFTTLFVLIPAEIPCSLIERLYICNGGIRLDMVSGREDKTSARCAVCYQVFDFTSHIIGSSERHYVWILSVPYIVRFLPKRFLKGQPKRVDDEHIRSGACCIFLFTEAIAG